MTDNDDWLDWDWGFMDGLLDMPLPEFLPLDSYFEGRREGGRARERKPSEAA